MSDDLIILLITGLAAGLLGGLLGIGGGVVLMPVLRFVVGLAPAEAAGTRVVAVFFTTLGGGIKHYRLGHVAIGSALVCFCANALISAVMKYAQGYVNLWLAVPLCLGCLAGSQLGAVINHRMPSRVLKLMFGLVFAWVSFRFIASGLGGTP